MRVSVDCDLCVGAGQCAERAPAVFGQDEDDGIAILLQESPPSHEYQAVREAAAGCPALAIHVHED